MAATANSPFLILCAIGVTLALSPAPAEAQADSRLPWDDPVNVASAATQPPWTHGSQEGLALSPDGAMAVSPAIDRPVNELLLIDWRRRTAKRIVYPNARMKLRDPAFSSDGRKLAFVVTPPNYLGRSEIWITDAEGHNAVLALGGGHFYRAPSFSPDGARLAYARDVEPAEPAGAGFPREYRQTHAYAFFEYDLRTHAETQLSQRVFGWVCGIHYMPKDDGFHVCAADPWMVSATTGRVEQPFLAGHLTDYMAYQTRIASGQNLFFKRGEELPELPPLFAPPEGPSKGARVVGVTASGAAILHTVESPHLAFYTATGAPVRPSINPSFAFTSHLIAYTAEGGAPIADILENRGRVSDWSGSADSQTFMVEQSCLLTQTSNDCRDPPTYLIAVGKARITVSLDQMKVDSEPVVLSAPPGSSLPSASDSAPAAKP